MIRAVKPSPIRLAACAPSENVRAPDVERALERGQQFAENEALCRKVVATTFFTPRPFESKVPESEAFEGRVELLGSIRAGRITYQDDGKTAIVEPAGVDFAKYGGRTYWELPNSTSLATEDADGRLQELVITRGIRPYQNRITPSAGIFNAPTGYVSDLLLFRRNDAGELELVHRLLDSAPEKGFLFEDPRISIVQDGERRRIFLSGTDYSPHVPGDPNPYVRNAYVELTLAPDGIPVPFTKKPNFHYLSPMPMLAAEGAVGVDAKNAVIAQRDDGKIVVRTRLRPDFDRDPIVKKYVERHGDRVPRWSYGVQTFVFEDLEHLLRYDFKNAVDLLLSSALGVAPIFPRRSSDPISAKLVLTDRDLTDFYPPELYVPNKPIGFGPGTRPIRIERQGERLLVSDGPGMPKHSAGLVPPALREPGRFLIEEGEVMHLSFDHKLRYLSVEDPDEPSRKIAQKRVYSGTVTAWEPDLETIRVLYDDVVQPTRPHQIGLTGITDLHHAAYNMGVVLLPEEDRTIVRVTGGEADAHTSSYDWDLPKLLAEMSPGSERRTTGQVYSPGRSGQP